MQDGKQIPPSEGIAARQMLPDLLQQLHQELLAEGIDANKAAHVSFVMSCHSCTEVYMPVCNAMQVFLNRNLCWVLKMPYALSTSKIDPCMAALPGTCILAYMSTCNRSLL